MTRTATFVALVLVSSLSFSAHAWNRLEATRFATLPPGTAHPEGITVDAEGNVYVADFDVTRAPTLQHPGGEIVVFDHAGRLVRHRIVRAGLAAGAFRSCALAGAPTECHLAGRME